MDLGLHDRRALVAAGSGGLGKGAARALAAEGARVAICGRDPDRVAAAAAEVGHDCIGLVGDVATPDGGRAFAEAAIGALGGCDILVTNAGGPPPGTATGTELDAYLTAFDLNCRSAIAMCDTVIGAMRANRWGRIVAITSAGVRNPIPNLAASSVARAGLTAYLKLLAREVAADGVTVNAVLPGFHATDRLTALHGTPDELAALAARIPTRTVGDPDDFGAVCAFLCSDAARFVTGVSLDVDGGANTSLL